MAALHDGKQFLVEKYAIATTPSLNLINRTSAAFEPFHNPVTPNEIRSCSDRRNK
jgi:CHAT domain-containing protein